jgi:hypothetical protein
MSENYNPPNRNFFDQRTNGMTHSQIAELMTRTTGLAEENKRLRAALEKIIEYHAHYAEDNDGDAAKAENYTCVQIARKALKGE